MYKQYDLIKSVDAVLESTESVDFEWEIFDGEKLLNKGKGEDGKFSFDTEGLALWSPETPILYT